MLNLFAEVKPSYGQNLESDEEEAKLAGPSAGISDVLEVNHTQVIKLNQQPSKFRSDRCDPNKYAHLSNSII